jgi:hypothetical protein
MKLGRLKKVDAREAWPTEDRHFTPWLASDENIELLSETLGLELEVEAQEKQVGPFRADILCRDVSSDAYVLIENQLEKTDHRHLGQVLTYAAGLKTAYIIWIASKFHEEHRAAMDWLNSISDDNFKFFGLEVELWSIGDSDFAPKFNIVSKPNTWSRNAKDGLRNIDQTKSDTKLLQRDFWDQFSEHLSQHHSIQPQKARAQHWLNISIGKTAVKITCVNKSLQNIFGVELYMYKENAKEIFHALQAQKADIEIELGYELEWQLLEDKVASRIAIYKDDFDIKQQDNWHIYNDWLAKHVCDFQFVFKQRLQSLD